MVQQRRENPRRLDGDGDTATRDGEIIEASRIRELEIEILNMPLELENDEAELNSRGRFVFVGWDREKFVERRKEKKRKRGKCKKTRSHLI